MGDTPAPIVAYDAHEHDWWALPDEQRDDFCVWMEDHGMDRFHTFHIEVYLVDAPYAVTREYVTGEDGFILIDAITRDVVTKTRTVLLSTLPPLEMDLPARFVPEEDG